MNPVKRNFAITMGIAAVFAIGVAWADDATSLRTESSRLEHNAAVTGESQVKSRISQDFASFAGSDTNADSLVTGLRSGSPITLAAPSGAAQQPSPVTFTPPPRPMGNGNIYISLALAKQQLTSLGITQPTPEQIKAALPPLARDPCVVAAHPQPGARTGAGTSSSGSQDIEPG